MITQLDTENADLNIAAAEITVLTHTPDAAAPRLCQALVLLGDGVKNLDATGGNFTIRAVVGGCYHAGRTQALAVGQATGMLLSEVFAVPAAMAVLVRVLSPNAADADVDVRAYLFDVGISADSTVQLASAGITKTKFDQSTAFALESVDSGGTKVARAGGVNAMTSRVSETQFQKIYGAEL